VVKPFDFVFTVAEVVPGGKKGEGMREMKNMKNIERERERERERKNTRERTQATSFNLSHNPTLP